MNIKNVTPGVVLIEMPTQISLCSTMVRFQEHYESPYDEIRGKIFTMEYYKELYSERDGVDGKFSYFTDWNGFNFPSWVVKPFVNGDFGKLRLEEEVFLNNLRKACDINKDFYVIGIHLENERGVSALKHEIAHGLYYTNLEYRARVDDIIDANNLTPLFSGFIESLGYCVEDEYILRDETHAFSGVDFNHYKKKYSKEFQKYGIKEEKVAEASENLNTLFLEYFKS